MYKNQLDGLRFFAFFFVFLSHIPGEPLPNLAGHRGVHLFFALSGFLITRILLINQTGQLLHDLRVFYARRFLRIFPLCYAVLIFCVLARQYTGILWFFTYTYNIKAWLLDEYDGVAPHFWSLCVEEQFYLTFPFILLLGPRRWQIAVLVAMIGLSALAGPAIALWFHNAFDTWLLPVCGQYLLWGCLAGFIELNTKARATLATWLFFFGLLVQAAVVTIEVLEDVEARPLNDPLASGLLTLSGISLAAIVFGLWRTENPILLKVFSFSCLAYLGKISYGLYVYHPWAQWNIAMPLWGIAPSWFTEHVNPTLSIGLVGFIVTVAMSVISWHWFESPINDYKDLFPYGKRKKSIAFQGASHSSESSLPAQAEQGSRIHKANRFLLKFTCMILALFVLAVSFQVIFKGLTWPWAAAQRLVHILW
jgi:peptidoglycan/LPS O-acetylase OafA/YrhL